MCYSVKQIDPAGVAVVYSLAVVGQILLKRRYIEDVLGEEVEVLPS